MARRVPAAPAGVERVFIPDVGGDPVRITLRNPSEAEKRRYHATGGVVEYEQGPDGKPKDGGAARVHPTAPDDRIERDRWLLERCVVRVEDYETQKGEKLTTGAQLAEHGESVIVYAVVAELLTGASLSAEQKKTSAAPSASTPSPQDPQPGTAASACATSSTSTAAAGQEGEQPQT